MPDPEFARVSRRGLLTLAAAAALPAACSRRSPSAAAPSVAAPSAGALAPTTEPAAGSTSIAPAATATKTPASAAPNVTATKTVAPGGGTVPYHRGKVLLGSYLSLQDRSLTQSLALRHQQLGRDQRIVHVYYSWTESLPSAAPKIGSGGTLMISWNGTRYSEITGGGSDKLIAAAARNLAKHKKPVLLRWGWEMNGNWFAWDGTHNGKKPAGYIKAWRRMHKIFQDEGADNVSWVWSPNWNSGPDVAWNAYEHYYPGDAYVDWVGVSAYPFTKQTPRTLFHRICSEYGARKPIMVAETASIDHGGSTKADWIKDFSAYVAATPAIGAVVWFDTDTQAGTDENFRIDTSKASLAAYRAMARSAHFSG